MSLEAILTVGWQDDSADKYSAVSLYAEAEQPKIDYLHVLTTKLKQAQSPVTILGLEQLLRHSTDKFKPIQKFVSNLLEVSSANKELGMLFCRIDAFAYAFLRGVKNLDLFLPESAVVGPFRKVLNDWSKTITTLEDFECLGKAFSPEIRLSANQYLDLRRLIARSSARDERRILTTLLVNGPSSEEEIAVDLGLDYAAGQRSLELFVDIGVVELRAREAYTLVQATLPLVVFCLRETMGIDLLAVYLTKGR